MYDEFFIDGDKPFAENMNDSVLLSNALEFDVLVSAPSMFSNGSFMDTATKRKCGVSTVKLDSTLPRGVSVDSSTGGLSFTGSATVDLLVYPNFNMFGKWDKIGWTCSSSSNLKVQLLTKTKDVIVSNVTNNGVLSTDSRLRVLDTIIVRLISTGACTLSKLDFYFKKTTAHVDNNSVRLRGYSTTEEVGTLITNAVPTKVSELTNDTGYVTESYHDNSKQDKLVSGSNIKTVNNQSLVGDGNLSPTNLGLSPTGHTHSTDDVTGLSSLLNGKANTNHTHNSSNINCGDTTLDNKLTTINNHITSSEASISDLQSRISTGFKVLSTGTHTISVRYIVLGDYKVVSLYYEITTPKTVKTGTNALYTGTQITSAWAPPAQIQIPYAKTLISFNSNGTINTYNDTGKDLPNYNPHFHCTYVVPNSNLE